VNDVADVVVALADPTRRRVLERLSEHGQATATMLARDLPISRQAVVQHLAVLDEVGLVTGHRHGRERNFEVRAQRLREAAAWMERLASQWDQRLSTIKRLSEGDSSD
jgi:DNA-binding transcriptional ArsR family regulator